MCKLLGCKGAHKRGWLTGLWPTDRAAALQLMESRKITSLLVVDPAGKLEGILHLHDLWSTGMI